MIFCYLNPYFSLFYGCFRLTQENSLKTLSGLQRLLEGGLIICCMVATYILLALSSFNPNDPGWSQSHYQGEIHNWTGAVGAWTADVLFYFFGFIAFLIPVIIATTGWFIFNRAHRIFEIDYFSVGLRIIGFMLMLLALAALVSMNAENMFVFSAGGVAGDVIGQAMLPYFNTLGTTLLLMCFICAGFTLATGISWLTIIELTGFAAIWCVKRIWTLPSLFKRERETEDTKGFMSLVDKFKQRRDELDEQSPFEQNDTPQPLKDNATSKLDTDDIEPVIEKKRSFFSRKPKVAEAIEPTAIDDDEIDYDDRLEPSITLEDDEPTFAPWVATKNDDENGFSANDDISDDVDITDTFDDAFEKPHSNGALVAQKQPKKEAKIVDGLVVIDGQAPQEKRKMDPLPSITLLDVPDRKKNPISEEELDQVARLVETKLADFNIIANVVGVFPGPVITRFELELAPGV